MGAHRELGDGDRRDGLRDLGQRPARGEVRADPLAQGVVLGRRTALLVDRRVVVVAGDVGLVALPARVRPRREAEVGAAVSHVEAERLLAGEQERDFLQELVELRPRPRLAPVGQPPRVGLGREDRDAGSDLSRQIPVRLLGARVEPDGGSFQVARLEHVGRGAVGGEERDVDPGAHPHLLQPAQVGPVVAVAAVLVLDLEHQDRTTVRHEQRADDRCQAVHVPLGGLHVARVEATDLEVGDAEQVGRDAAKVPLGAHVGPGAEEHPQALGLDEPEEPGEVTLAGREVEHSLGGLVMVPEDVGGDGVAAHGLRHPDPVRPVLRGDPRGVQLTADHLERRAVQQEVGRTQREGVLRDLGGSSLRLGRDGRQGQERHDDGLLHVTASREPPVSAPAE